MAEQTTWVDPQVAVKDMGFQGLSGPSRGRLAALKKYGLLEDGPKGVRLTPLAAAIMVPESPAAEQAAIDHAAMVPDLWRELMETHRLASNDAIRSHLVRNKGFSELGAKVAIQAFRDTMAIAKNPDEGYANPSEVAGDSAAMIETAVADQPPGLRVSGGRAPALPIPIAPGSYVTLQGPFPLSEDEWAQLQAILTAMKPSLTRKKETTAPPSASDDASGSSRS